MKDALFPAQRVTSGLVSLFLMSAVSTLCLWTFSWGTESWSESVPVRANEHVNSPVKMEVVYHEGILSVSLKKADFVKVLDQIARQSNVEIIFNGPIKEEVTLEFVNLSLERGLTRILENKNYIFTYSEKWDPKQREGRYALTRVILIGRLSSGNPLPDQAPEIQREAGWRSHDRGSRLGHLNETETELMNMLLGREPEDQEKTLEDLGEMVEARLKEIHLELTESSEGRDGKGGGGAAFEVEAAERLLQELEAGNNNIRSLD